MLAVMNPISIYVCKVNYSIFIINIIMLLQKNTAKQGRNYVFESPAHQGDSWQGKSWSILLPSLSLSSQNS